MQKTSSRSSRSKDWCTASLMKPVFFLRNILGSMELRTLHAVELVSGFISVPFWNFAARKDQLNSSIKLSKTCSLSTSGGFEMLPVVRSS